MSESSSNRTFFIRFGIVIVALHAVVGVLVLISLGVGDEDRNPQLERALLNERIEPVGRVIVTQAELVRTVRASDPAPQAAIANASGEDVVAQICAPCHGSGLMNAPKIGDQAAWQASEQAAGGADGLLARAIEGVGQMQPRGGAPQLSDEQLRAAIEIMRR